MIGVVLAFGAIVSVLAFGGVQPLGFAPAQITVAVLATVIFWKRGWPSVSRPTLCVLGTLLAIPLVQLIPFPRAVVAVLSPARVAFADNLFALSWSPPENLALTVNSFETQLSLLRLVCYMLVFLLAFRDYQQRREAHFLIGVLVGLGIFEAVYGGIQYLTGWPYIFTYRKLAYAQEATGTYINRNHFAGLLEMVLPFLLAEILLRHRKGGGRRRSAWIDFITSPMTFRSLGRLVLFALICVALVFSKSRGGIAGLFAGILVVGAIAFYQTRRRWMAVTLPLILALPVVYSFWIGITPVIGRFEALAQAGAFEQDRLALWRDTVALIQDYPLLGTGLGTYPWSSIYYQSTNLTMRYEHAHNDYLEFAADIGIPAAVVLFGSLWFLLGKIVRQAPALEHSRERILAAGCAGSFLALLTHEIVDFNLQIPANAFLFSWIAGTVAAMVQEPLEHAHHGVRTKEVVFQVEPE